MSTARISPSASARARSAPATRREAARLSSAIPPLAQLARRARRGRRTRGPGSPRSPGRARGRRPRGPAALVPADSRAAPDQGEEAAVVLVARALGGVDRVGVAPVHHGHLGQHAPQRRVPLDRVVAARLPRVDQHRLAGAARVALLEQEAVPAEQRARAARGRGARRGGSRTGAARRSPRRGGWVIPEMRRPSTRGGGPTSAGRAGSARRAGRPSSAAPRRRPFTRSGTRVWNAMCGIIPCRSRAPASVSSSVQARAGSSSAQPSAASAESQFHWCG